MPYVITDLCTNDGSCVEVCPVACIHTMSGAPQFYVDPEVCIDCEQCEIVCPVDAIFKDIDIPAAYLAAIDVNAAFFRQNKAAIEPVPFATAVTRPLRSLRWTVRSRAPVDSISSTPSSNVPKK